MAHRDVLRRLIALVAIGGIADINGHFAPAKSVAIDPKRTKRGPKSRSAAGLALACCPLRRRPGSAQADSEQFRSDPRTCHPLWGRLDCGTTPGPEDQVMKMQGTGMRIGVTVLVLGVSLLSISA